MTERSCFRCGQSLVGGGRVCSNCKQPKSKSKELDPRLSFREKQVAEKVTQGKLNKQIAYELYLTEGTIKEYLHRIFQKVRVTNRTELAIWWIGQRDQHSSQQQIEPAGLRKGNETFADEVRGLKESMSHSEVPSDRSWLGSVKVQ